MGLAPHSRKLLDCRRRSSVLVTELQTYAGSQTKFPYYHDFLCRFNMWLAYRVQQGTFPRLRLDNTNDHGTSTLSQNMRLPHLFIVVRLMMVILPSRTVNTGTTATPEGALMTPLIYSPAISSSPLVDRL